MVLPMLKYIIKRFIQMIPVLFLVATIVFVLMRVVPGDPAILMLSGQGAVTPQMVAELHEQLGLDRSRHIADLIKENRAAVSFLQQSSLVFVCRGESPFCKSKQFRLEQVLRDSPAINGNKTRRATFRVVMDCPCKQFLAGTGGSREENGDISG